MNNETLLIIELVTLAILVTVFFRVRKRTIQKERTLAQQKVRESETRYDKILENVVDGIVSIDENGTIEIFNAAAERIFGYKALEVWGKNIKTLMPEPDRAEHDRYIENYLRSRESTVLGIQRELTGLRKNGSTFPMEIALSEIFHGARRTFTAVIRDITDRKKQEKAFRDETAYVQLLHSVSSAANEAATFEEAIQICLDRICKLTGWAIGHLFLPTPDSPPNLQSTRIWFLSDPHRFKKFRELTDSEIINYGEGLAGRVLATGRHTWVRNVTEDPRARKGRFSPDSGIASGFAFPVLIGREVVGVIEFFSTHPVPPDQRLLDVVNQIGTQLGRVVERRRAQDTIIRAKEKAEEAQRAADRASQAKTDFLANMSHEIRTPMNAIIGMSELLAETPLNPEQQQMVNIFRGAGENLLTLINDILDLSKIEAGQIELDNVEFNPWHLVEKTIEVLDLKAQEKGLPLNYHIAPEVPHLLFGDSHRLRQVLTNLISNAIKFTEQGEILIRVEQDPEAQDAGGLMFTVSDTGIGIRPEKLETIFESFSQADSSTTRKYGGTGLGLSICKRFVERMNGRIWVESGFGKGSTFHFTVRFIVCDPPESVQEVKPEKLRGVKALLIEHRSSIRGMLNDQLLDWGMAAKAVDNAQAGLDALKKAEAQNHPYQLLLLNSRLPSIGGFGLLDRVFAELQAPVPTLMMMPIDTRKGDIDRCKEMGVVEYMTKFIHPEVLLQKIHAALGHEAPTPGEGSAPLSREPSIKKDALKILLVEDSEDNRLLVQLYLKKTPHQIDTAENGEVAVNKCKCGAYDLVLMDMQMPVMDGYTATRAIRVWEKEQRREEMPIIALTSHALKGDMEKCLQAGCTGYLSKPIKKDKILGALERYSQKAHHPVNA